MNRFWRKRESFVVLTVAMLVILLIAPASARDLNKLLKGDYAANFTLNCATSMVSGGGFDRDTLERIGPGNRFSASVQGTQSFDGKGGVTTDYEVLVIGSDDFYPVGQYDVDCAGTYQVFPDMTTRSDVDCEVVRLTPLPPPPTLSLPSPLTLVGVMREGRIFGAKRGIISLGTDTIPNIETYYFTPPVPGADPIPVMERICGNTGTSVKIWN